MFLSRKKSILILTKNISVFRAIVKKENVGFGTNLVVPVLSVNLSILNLIVAIT